MRAPRRWIAMLLAATALLGATPASAHGIRKLVRESGDLPEVQRLVELHHELHGLLARYRRLEAGAGHVWLAAALAMRDADAAARAVDEARSRLEQRVRTAYQFGPAGQVDALLGAPSFADLATITEYASRTISLDREALTATYVTQAVLLARRAQTEAEQEALAGRLGRLRSLLDRMRAKVDEATAIARQAQLEAMIEAERQQVAEALARSGSWDLGVVDYGTDQSSLLSLLGPTGGQTCDTPEGLVEAGRSFEGYASWYGWEFGGQPTATGAIFDPRLFTAANRWLPFGTFLRVRAGDRCAIVLINDRGPYGHLERVIDLSQAAAQYLGVGVTWVRADILLPAESLG